MSEKSHCDCAECSNRTEEFLDSLLGTACSQDGVGILKLFQITTHCVEWKVVAFKDSNGHWVISDFHQVQKA